MSCCLRNGAISARSFTAVLAMGVELAAVSQAVFSLAGGVRPAAAAVHGLPLVQPESVGMDSARLLRIDDVVAEGLANRQMPGCVVTVGRKGAIAFQRAYGYRQLQPTKAMMTLDTVFDLASLTKPIATATSVMQLVEQGKLDPQDRGAHYWPEFGQNGKQAVTVFQLLTHQAGLLPDNSLSDYQDGPPLALQRICQLKASDEPGSKFVYSDVGFIVLGELVKRISGKDVDQFSREMIFQPLGMNETGFRPAAPLRARAATTQRREEQWMIGEVHDPRAFLLGGVAGHAGLFSTAEDLAVYAQMMVSGGQYRGRRILKTDTVDRMTRGYPVSRGWRGLGWDVRSGYSSNRGDLFSARAFGHGGFTGTAIWIDPALELFVIFLSNRVHPDGSGSVNLLAGRIGTLAAAAIGGDRDQGAVASDFRQEPGSADQSPVLTGIDVLQREGFRRVSGQRLGLITNQTGLNRQGVSTVELLHRAPAVQLTALFSPEHGLEGRLDIPRIGDGQHAQTGLKVYSLYGESRSPTPESLKSVDTLVFDIQDIGSRFYTYISTMGNAMQAAAEQHVRFLVLDRPNPINGVDVAGPVLDPGRQSFVAFHNIPIRHGMTAGELAMMFRDELQLDLQLDVVRMEGWRRSELFDATGLTWVNPSPNMRSLTQALLYPGIGLLETTNVSVGRGTDTPFEVLGAPWLDGAILAQSLNRSQLPGVRFVPVRFTPSASKCAGQACGGVNVIITRREIFRPLRCGWEIARQLRLLYPDQWQALDYARLLGSEKTLQAILACRPTSEIEALLEPELNEFRRRRQKYLLYD